MKKKYLSVIIFLITLVCAIFLMSNVVYADLLEDLKTQTSGASDGTNLSNVTGSITIVFNLIKYAGTGISIITMMILGIKYITASVETKAEVKKQAIPVMVGCIFIFGASNLAAIIADIATDL